MGGSWLKAVFCTALVLASLSCASSSNRERTNSNAEENQPPTIAITVGRSESRDVAASIQATGSVTADETSDIAPKVAGKISNISIFAGEFISGGSVVARIDDRDARLELAAAQAAVRKAKVSITQAELKIGLGPDGKFTASTIPEVRVAASIHELRLAELRQAEADDHLRNF